MLLGRQASGLSKGTVMAKRPIIITSDQLLMTSRLTVGHMATSMQVLQYRPNNTALSLINTYTTNKFSITKHT